MNLYEVSISDWVVRVKASKFSTATRIALDRVEENLHLNSRRNERVNVYARVVIRDIPKDYKVPTFADVSTSELLENNQRAL